MIEPLSYYFVGNNKYLFEESREGRAGRCESDVVVKFSRDQSMMLLLYSKYGAFFLFAFC